MIAAMAATDPELERLLPSPSGPTTIHAAYAVAREPHRDRPWINLCMIASLDGSVALGGTSGGLGNANDLDVLLTLRSVADAILVGARTVSGEGYGPPRKVGQRIGVVTNSARVDVDTDLFRSGAGFIVTNERAPVPEHVDVLRAGVERVDLREVARRLRDVVPGARHVQAEGGPALNGSLVDAGLVDEICLNFAPLVIGGDGPRMTIGAAEERRRYALAHVLTDADGYLVTRWLRR